MRNVKATPGYHAVDSITARAPRARGTSQCVPREDTPREAWRVDWRYMRAGVTARMYAYGVASAACWVAARLPDSLVTLEASGR